LSKSIPPDFELKNLVRIGKLKREPPAAAETTGLIASGRKRLHDAQNLSLSFESRFDLAYNAAHALALAALRQTGYRSDNRYLVFQALPHTIGLPPAHWRVLAKAHEVRNLAEYEGHTDEDEALLAGVIAAAAMIQTSLDATRDDSTA
jgi:hypothetical protein